MILHDSMNDREAQARSSTRSFGREEWLEYVRQFIHSTTGVSDGKLRIPPRRKLGRGAREGNIERNRLRADGESTVIRHRMGRVGCQVHDDLMDLRSVGQNGGNIRSP